MLQMPEYIHRVYNKIAVLKMKPVVILQSGLSYETLCDVRPQAPQAHEWELLLLNRNIIRVNNNN